MADRTSPRWPLAAITLLQEIWPDHTCEESGRILTASGLFAVGKVISKNAVVGMGRRLHLDMRGAAQPMRQGADYQPTRRMRGQPPPGGPSVTLADTVSTGDRLVTWSVSRAIAPPLDLGEPKEKRRRGPPPRDMRHDPPRSTALRATLGDRVQTSDAITNRLLSEPPPFRRSPPVVVALHRNTCQFPFGDPKNPAFHFCGAPTWSCSHPLRSHVYCHDHYNLSYKKLLVQEDAA
jgi:hypothetical protein